MKEILTIKVEADKPQAIFIPVKNITSLFAKNAIQLSPYRVPDDLSTAVLKFHSRLEEILGEKIGFHGKWISCQITRKEWTRILMHIITDPKFTEVHQWNERKNGDNKNPFNFVCATSNTVDPDDDFIDLDALAMNVIRESWYLMVPDAEAKDNSSCMVTPVNEAGDGKLE